MKQEFIILRDPDFFRNSSSCHSEEVKLPEIEIEELSLDEVARCKEQNAVVAVMANMPIELNSTFLPGLSGVETGSEDDRSWGIEAIGARQTTLDGEGMVAALLDTGINCFHPTFQGMEIIEQDFTGCGLGDENGHGTHSAATIFGQPVQGREIGIAPGIDFALVAKILDEHGRGECWSAVQALLWAVSNGANVVNLSFRLSFCRYVDQLIESGYPHDIATAFALDAYHTTIEFFRRFVAILRLRSKALVIVAGAGDSTRKFENLAWDRLVEAPARIPGIISVGALEDGIEGYKVAAFSNAGPTGVAPGVGIISADSSTGRLISREGSSVAANHAAGAALLWGEFLEEWDNLTSFTLETKLKRSCCSELLQAGYREIEVGKGLFQAPLEESERNWIEEEVQQTYYEVDIGDQIDPSVFDSNHKSRKARENLFRQMVERQFRRGKKR
ncbi:MAG: S8 family serine peptidase [Verrucomicrobiales bacterium]|nr:S8 family serine peptidase [Verrucomicrobiales bacterium]